MTLRRREADCDVTCDITLDSESAPSIATGRVVSIDSGDRLSAAGVSGSKAVAASSSAYYPKTRPIDGIAKVCG